VDTQRRKDEHIRINLEEPVRSALTTGLERYQLPHEALPEIDLKEVQTETTVFTKKVSMPLFISSMTGGTDATDRINAHLAEAAQVKKVAMGVGSERVLLEYPERIPYFRDVRKRAADIPLFANLGAVQLNYGVRIDDVLRLIDVIEADGLILHLNPLQEALQMGGNTNFSGLASKISTLAHTLSIPIIVKEVGWGISPRTAQLLHNAGVSVIDIAGAGGTSWSEVEKRRLQDEKKKQLAASFVAWGLPTALSLEHVRKAVPEMTLWASGGLTNGLDVAKILLLGASMGGMAGRFLHAAQDGPTHVIDLLDVLQEELRLAMFLAGARTLNEFQTKTLIRLDAWSSQGGEQ